MNVATFSPALTLWYVFALLWILMGVELKNFSRSQRWLILLAAVALSGGNHLLRGMLGAETYGKLLIPLLHLPTFVLFLYIAKRGVVKTAFMILTATVFTTPAVIIGNLVRRTLFVGSSRALLLSNLISYALMLLLAYVVFRGGFNYLLVHGDARLFLQFSIVPFVFYIYMLASVNLDFSALMSPAGYVVRLTPTAEVLVVYFMLPFVYKKLREEQNMKSAQTALQQKLDSAQERITLLGESTMQMEVYRHDMRHQLTMLNGLLSAGKTTQAQEYIQTVIHDLGAIIPKKFCANETVNLLCSSYDGKARRLGVDLAIEAGLPKTIPLPDTELCSVISNGLENALRAASQPEVAEKWVELYCEIKKNKLLIQIRNPYVGRVTVQNGLPVSSRAGHGYGCHSIRAIAENHGGLCDFEAENGLFTLRVALPLPM